MDEVEKLIRAYKGGAGNADLADWLLKGDHLAKLREGLKETKYPAHEPVEVPVAVPVPSEAPTPVKKAKSKPTKQKKAVSTPASVAVNAEIAELEKAKDENELLKALSKIMKKDEEHKVDTGHSRERLEKGFTPDENAIRHKKYREVKAAREDLSEKLKEVISGLQDEGDYKLAIFQGRAGGNRKVLQCPHCSGKMVASGVKAARERERGLPQTQGQREWQDYIKVVTTIPEYKGLSRPKMLKAASALRAAGYTIDQIKDLGDRPVLSKNAIKSEGT